MLCFSCCFVTAVIMEIALSTRAEHRKPVIPRLGNRPQYVKAVAVFKWEMIKCTRQCSLIFTEHITKTIWSLRTWQYTCWKQRSDWIQQQSKLVPENADQEAGAWCKTCTLHLRAALMGCTLTSSSHGASSSHKPCMQSPPPWFTESYNEYYPKALLQNSVMAELHLYCVFFMSTTSFLKWRQPHVHPIFCRGCNSTLKYAGGNKLVHIC